MVKLKRKRVRAASAHWRAGMSKRFRDEAPGQNLPRRPCESLPQRANESYFAAGVHSQKFQKNCGESGAGVTPDTLLSQAVTPGNWNRVTPYASS